MPRALASRVSLDSCCHWQCDMEAHAEFYQCHWQQEGSLLRLRACIKLELPLAVPRAINAAAAAASAWAAVSATRIDVGMRLLAVIIMF